MGPEDPYEEKKAYMDLSPKASMALHHRTQAGAPKIARVRALSRSRTIRGSWWGHSDAAALASAPQLMAALFLTGGRRTPLLSPWSHTSQQRRHSPAQRDLGKHIPFSSLRSPV